MAARKHSQPSRSKRSWRADKPYNKIPLLPPKVDLETKAILKQCIRARAALAELKGAAELIPNPSVLINTLPLLEAQASSEIENIVTTTDRLFQFRELHAQADPATKAALRYSRALLEGLSGCAKASVDHEDRGRDLYPNQRSANASATRSGYSTGK